MPNPAALIPGVQEGLTAIQAAVAAAGIDGRLLALSRLRASQINGCGPDVAAAARRAREQGVTGEQVDTVAVWREAPRVRDEARAVPAPTEAGHPGADPGDPGAGRGGGRGGPPPPPQA